MSQIFLKLIILTAGSKERKFSPLSISVLEYQAVQILLLSVNGCYGTPSFAFIHVLFGSFFVNGTANLIIHRLRHGLFLFILRILNSTAGLLFSYVTYRLSENLFLASMERLRKFKIHNGKIRRTKATLASLPLLYLKTGWIIFKYFSTTQFLLFVDTCVNYLIAILLFNMKNE